MTDEVKNEAVIDDAEIKEVTDQQAPQIDQAVAEISRVASAACFGVGSRADAITRMASIGTNLIVMAIAENSPEERQRLFGQILGTLAQAAGIEIKSADEAAPEESTAEA